MSIDDIPRPRSGSAFLDETPQAREAEKAVLGAVLLSPQVFRDAADVVKGSDFYAPAHELIWEAVVALDAKGQPADAVTVLAQLRARGNLERVGGPAYLHHLVQSTPVAGNVGYYARLVAETAAARRLVEVGRRIIQLGMAGGAEVGDLQQQAHALLSAATEDDSAAGDVVQVAIPVQEAVDAIDAASCHDRPVTGIPTGFADLDALTGGLRPAQMIVIGARPAMGKSTVGLDILRSAAIGHRMTSVMFSLEMSREEIGMRLLSAEGRIPLQNMRKGTMRVDDWPRLSTAVEKVQDAPLFIDDSPNLSLPQIRAKCRWLKERHDLKLVVIDYLQLMSSGKRVESRQQEVSEFSRLIKLLAKELQVPVIALSQLNRGPEQRTDKKPSMSDLRESGSVEQDADMVILLHREDAYDKESPRAGEADFIVAKHRNGPTDTITVAFQGHYSRFVDMAPPA